MSDASQPSAPAPVRWLVLAGVWLLYCCFGMVSSSLAPLVEPVTLDLGMSHTAMGTVLGVWQFVYIFASVPCGALLDRLGTRIALVLGGALIAASGALRSAALDPWTLVLAVAVFGIGGPIVSAGAPKVVAQWFQGRERGLAMGLYITGPSVGAIAALALTNAVLMPAFGGDWRAVLLLWGIAGLLGTAAWLAVASLPATRRAEPAAPAIRARQRDVLGELLRLGAIRQVLLMNVGVFMYNHGLNNWLPELLRSGGMSAAGAGYWATLPTAVGIAGSLLIPRLAIPGRRFAILAALCAGAVVAALLLLASGPLLVAGLVLQGIVRSSLMTIMMLTVVELPGVGDRRAGMAAGLFFAAAEIGGASGPVALGTLYDVTGGFRAGLLLLAGIAVLLLLGVWRLRRLAG